MVAVQIRDVPDDIRRTLSERAAARGQSLQSFLLAVLTDEAGRGDNLVLLERFGNRNDGSQLTSTEATELLDQARTERDAHLERRAPGLG